MPDALTPAQLEILRDQAQQQDPVSKLLRMAGREIDRVHEENAELNGIISGLSDTLSARVKPVERVREEMKEKSNA